MSAQKNPVIFVVGSTATGKSDWALKMAQKFSGVIFNCDSVQVYKEINIGSAKPSLEERQLVPHYLLDYVEPNDEMTAGQFTRDFFAEMLKVPENVPVFVVGGTGFYFQALEKGMYPVTAIPQEIQDSVNASLETIEGCEALYKELQERDPAAAKKIHPADHYRIGRAIELMRSHGKSLTEIRADFAKQQSIFPYPLLKIGLNWDRDVLRTRILERTEKMISAGLIDEVKGLLSRGLQEWGPLSSVGYFETMEYLENNETIDWLKNEIATNTHQLAKRQKTWFQRDKEIRWFDGASEYDKAASLVESFIGSCQNRFKEST